jgi:RNA polymerase sigma-70 factor, ECF subfamily
MKTNPSAKKRRRRPALIEMPVDPSKTMQETYQELRCIAGHLFQGERCDHTLQPTALVHEAFIRLAKNGPTHYANRAHFFGIVVRTMRRILVEHARHHHATRHGGGLAKLSLEDAEAVSAGSVDFLALNAALDRLNRLDPSLRRIAELRIFGGLSNAQTATLVKRGESTTRRDWKLAKVWLRGQLESSS